MSYAVDEIVKDTLPDKLSDLIEVALRDLESVENDQNYTVDMHLWQSPNYGTCHVCLAGSVLAKTLKVPKGRGISPAELYTRNTPLARKLFALNAVRTAHVPGALNWLGKRSPFVERELSRTFISYNDDPARWKDWVRYVVTKLREHDL